MIQQLPRIIIALTGAKGSGKDTAADALVSDLGFTRLKFATPLKDMLATLYRHAGVDEATILRKLEGDLKEVPCEVLLGKTPRLAMQTLGSEWRDLIDKNLWTNLILQRIASANPVVNFVVTDLRFRHELDAVHRLGGRVMRVVRPGHDPNEHSTHVSEVEMRSLPVDDTVLNDDTIGTLQARALGSVLRSVGHRLGRRG